MSKLFYQTLQINHIMNENDEIFESFSRFTKDSVEQVVKHGNSKAVSAGFGGLVAYASAGAIGAEIAVAVGLTAGAAPIVALGLGYLAYKGGQKAYNTFYDKLVDQKNNPTSE